MTMNSAFGSGAVVPSRRSWVQRSIIFINVVLIGCCLAVAAVLNYGFDRASSINRVELDRSLTPLPQEAQRGQRVLNILLVGSDSSAGLGSDDPIQIGRRGERFGDVIIVAHLDERSGEVALLSFPRDLWVDVAGTSRSARINKAFELGGPSMLIDTIETEFDVPIHHYVNVDFAGFQGVVSAVGSVDVYFEEPARDWNAKAKPAPRSQTGFLMAEAGCQSLDPPTALAYVRSRYYQTMNEDGEWVTDPSSDLGRIRRQQDFLRRLLQRAIDLGARNPFVLNDLIDAGLANVAIDQSLTPQQLLDLSTAYQSFEPDQLQTYSVPVSDEVVGQDQVLVAKPEALEPILEIFRGASLDDPATVPVTVATPAGEWLVADLRAAGFEVSYQTRGAGDERVGDESGTGEPVADLITGTTSGRGSQVAADSEPITDSESGLASEFSTIVIQHGPDGRHAAGVVATAVTELAKKSGRTISVDTEQLSYLPARSTILSAQATPLGAAVAEPDGDAALESATTVTGEQQPVDRDDSIDPESDRQADVQVELPTGICG